MTDDPRLPRRATKSKYKPGSAPLKKNPSKIIDKGEREPRCPYCEKRFADAGSLNDHEFFCRLKHDREAGVQE